MKIAILPGSLRKDSFNKKLAANILKIAKSKSHDGTLIDLVHYQVPLFNEDLESQSGLPPSINEIDNLIKSANALILVSPEYNGAMPGVLKNVLDWLSRVEPHCFIKKPVLCFTASPGALGGIKCLGQTQALMNHLGSYVYPQGFSLPRAHEAFNNNHLIAEAKTQSKIESLLETFFEYTQRLGKL